MPSSTFFNLPEEKRERLIQGAMKEFVEMPLHKASVSNIIINAKISRGSFYQYFEDINDLYLYVVGLFHQNIYMLLRKCLIEKEGHFIKGLTEFGHRYIRGIMTNKKVGFYKNMYLNMNYSLQKEMKHLLADAEEAGSNKGLKGVLEKINYETIRIQEEEELIEFLDFCINMLDQTIIEGFYSEGSVETTQDVFQKRLNWLAEGINRRSV